MNIIMKKKNHNLRAKLKCKELFSLTGQALRDWGSGSLKIFELLKRKVFLPASLSGASFSRRGERDIRATGDEAQGPIWEGESTVERPLCTRQSFSHNLMQTGLLN